MEIAALLHLTTTDLFLYFLGAAALVAIPPLVGAVVLRMLFSPVANGRGPLARLLGALGLGLSVAFALGATGISLLRPAPPDLFIALIILCVVFAMLGAGQLYWTEE
ncbi:MAG: hypothetical protein IPL28_14070 [Chloroflexi bacterium]|nr:hypothetical protein [Chloroflexota bacterium]